jgi:hypothetical protein
MNDCDFLKSLVLDSVSVQDNQGAVPLMKHTSGKDTSLG